jgi:uncharacterized protein YkwD
MNGKFTRTVARVLAIAAITGAAVLGATTTASAAPADCTYNPNGRGGYGTYLDKIAVDQRDWEVDLFNAINVYRGQHGLAALAFSRTLARPAMWASLDSYNRGFSPSNHIDTRGMNVPQRVQFCSGYTGYVGEINYWAWGGGQGTTVQGALTWWKNSPGHNARLLDPNSRTMAVGLAYAGNDRNRTHYTVVFGDH